MDDDLFADEEDRRQVMSMNEKDREQEIFNRMEQQEMRRTRYVVRLFCLFFFFLKLHLNCNADLVEKGDY